ncbi:efflux RND transporter periplasmic adaptor subunit [Limnoglobus roseus]|uniref:HlyD family secretion protein n=1 Tax=Limnoglobus roseus TaxID=2598579 RepID=A0A5C1AKX1_9BACT|nr:efflux RND transporter periplasmic adaptor subunit [Limnoglobus roseus]QEL19871.1 HlyD family secretion protein [Limnoglobus roseus]
MRKYFSIGLALALVLGGAAYWLWAPARASGVTFLTEPVTRGELLATVGGTGTLEPEDVIDVGTQVAGLIKTFGNGTDGKLIDYGSPVGPGTVLARIDDALYAARAEQSRSLVGSAEQKVLQTKAKVDEAVANTNTSRAALMQAQARANQSKRDWDRAKTMKASATISDQEYDAAQSAFEVNTAGVVVSEATIAQAVATEADFRASVGDAEAAVRTAKAVLRQDEINLGYCIIKSDVAGTVIDRRVTIGQTVQSSFNTPSLFLIAKDLKKMKVWASVNESDIGQIHVGQAVAFTVDAYPKKTFRGAVARVRLNATNTQNVVVYTVEVTTDNPDGLLLPYMTANLKFEVDRRADALLVPNAALRYRPAANLVSGTASGSKQSGGAGDKPNPGVVYVEDAGKLRAVPVELGLTDGTMTEVVAGDLPAGAAVIVGESRSGGTPNTAENPFAPKPGGKK